MMKEAVTEIVIKVALFTLGSRKGLLRKMISKFCQQQHKLMKENIQIINETAVGKSMPSIEVIQKLSKSFSRLLEKRLLATKDRLHEATSDNLNV